MGTSGSSRGTGNNKSLVPTFTENPPSKPLPGGDGSQGDGGSGSGGGGSPNPDIPRQPIPQPAPDNRFSGARRNFSTFAASGGNDRRALQRAVRDYVRSGYGSSRNATRSMGASRASAANVLGVLRGLARDGAAQTLINFNLANLNGRPAREVLAALTDVICEDGGTLDQAIAREAWLETIAAVEATGIVDVDAMSTEQFSEVFLTFISQSVQAKLFQEIGVNGFKVADLEEIRAFESQFRNYVDGRVRDSFNGDVSDLANMSDDRIRAVVEQTYRDAWELFVTWGDRE